MVVSRLVSTATGVMMMDAIRITLNMDPVTVRRGDWRHFPKLPVILDGDNLAVAAVVEEVDGHNGTVTLSLCPLGERIFSKLESGEYSLSPVAVRGGGSFDIVALNVDTNQKGTKK